jgi:hypothetical protein
MSRKDDFKNNYQSEMTSTDLDCLHLYHPKWRGKAKKQFRKMARKRLKENIAKEYENQQLKFYLVCCYEDVSDDDSCYDEMQVSPNNYEFAKGYIGHKGFKVFSVYKDGLMEEL